jgi:hypothetical protein
VICSAIHAVDSGGISGYFGRLGYQTGLTIDMEPFAEISVGVSDYFLFADNPPGIVSSPYVLHGL